MLELVVSGGQTGADQAGWRAAKAAGIPTAGYMPKGFWAEDGNHPEFAGLYGAQEIQECGKPLSRAEALRLRTWLNVRQSEMTLWFGDPDTPGGKATAKACADVGRPIWHVTKGVTTPREISDLIVGGDYKVINIAGNRASTAPEGFGDEVERFLSKVFRSLTSDPGPARRDHR